MRRPPIRTLAASARGSSFIMVLVFGAVISVTAAIVFRSTMFQREMAGRSESFMNALAVAEAGAEMAMVELNRPANAFDGWSGSDPLELATQITDVRNNVVGDVSIRVVDLGATPRVISTGYVPSRANPRAVRTIVLSAENNTVPPPWGEFGLFAFGNLTFNGGTTTDSYEPSNPSTMTHSATVGAIGNISFYGSHTIWGNVHAGNDLWFDNNSMKVYGDAFYGNSLGFPKWNDPTITGERRKTSMRMPERQEIPETPARPASNNNAAIRIRPLNGGGTTKDGLPSGATLQLSNSKVTFPAPGVYYLSEMKQSNNSQFEVVGEGDVTIYVDTTMNMKGLSAIDFKPASGNGGPNVTIIANTFQSSEYGQSTLHQSSRLSIFAESLSVSNGHYISVSDNAKLTLVGTNVSFGGGSAVNMKQQYSNNPGNTSNVVIYARQNAEFKQGAKVSGVYYGPDATTRFTGGFDWWGAVVGGDITISGGPGIRIDQGLFEASGGSGAFVRVWTEVAPEIF